MRAPRERLAATIDAVLTKRNVLLYSAICAATMLLATGSAIARGRFPLDVFGHVVAADFLARLAGGWILSNGDVGRLYDPTYQADISSQILGVPRPGALTLFTAPSFLALLYAPFAALPYGIAVLLWTALTLALIATSVWLLWPLVPSLHRFGFPIVLAIALASYPIVELLADGQDAALSLVLLAGSLRLLLARRDAAAGLLLGFGVFKPQLFLLVPLMLALRGRWRAVAGWLATAAGAALVSIALLGPGGVTSYATFLTSDAYNRSEIGVGWKMLSALGPLRPIVPASATLAVALGALAVGGILLVLALRRSSDDALAVSLAVLITALVSAKVMIYDYAILLMPALLLIERAPDRRAVRLALAAISLLTFSAAGRQAAFGAAPWPISALAAQWVVIPVAVLAWQAWRATRETADARGRIAAVGSLLEQAG